MKPIHLLLLVNPKLVYFLEGKLRLRTVQATVDKFMFILCIPAFLWFHPLLFKLVSSMTDSYSFLEVN